jgi:radical SAM protein with 4Fe4S-binding SPASM domain
MNDILRVDSSGLGTYDAIIRSIELLVRNGISPSVSTSITPHNLPHLDSLSEFFLNLGVKKFGFNFLKGKELLELVRPEDLESYYIEASKGIVRNYKLHPDHHFEYQMEKKVVAFDSQDFFPVDCTCYGNQIVVTPSGQVTNCPFLRTPLGHVEELGHDFQICEQPIVKLWRERLPLFSPAYKNFEAKAMCGGGCAWSTGEIKGNISAVDDSSFIFAREVLDELIWSRFETPTRQEA